MVMIDTTTRCNLACAHCPNSVLAEDQSWLGDMDFDLYKKIIDEVAAERPEAVVRPFDGGEPLMHKQMEEMIRYAKEKGIRKVAFTTNGLLFTEKRARAILEAGIDEIEFSIDAVTPETYLKIRKSEHFDRLIENIERVLALRPEINPALRVHVSFVKQQDNMFEAKEFEEFWTPKVDFVGIREYHQHNALVDDHGRYEKDTPPERHPCPYLWNRIIIQHNGKIRFCEFDWKAEHAIGDVRTQSLKEVWHGERYKTLRDQHVAGTFDYPYCKGCTDWREVRWNI